MRSVGGREEVVAQTKRRYSEFRALHSAVQFGLDLPPFAASKKPFGMSKKDRIERRRQLDGFLIGTVRAAKLSSENGKLDGDPRRASVTERVASIELASQEDPVLRDEVQRRDPVPLQPAGKKGGKMERAQHEGGEPREVGG